MMDPDSGQARAKAQERPQFQLLLIVPLSKNGFYL